MKLSTLAVLAVATLIGLGGCNTTKTDSRTAETTPATGGATDAPDEAGAEAPRVGALTAVTPSGGGDAAPDFSWSDATGQHKLSDYRGRVVMINFWGTWCPPCRRELPSLVKLREEFGQEKFEIIGINVGEQARGGQSIEQHVATFASNNDIRYPLVIADENIVNAYGGIEVVPTTFIVNGDGRIVQAIRGSRDEAGFRELIQGAM